MPVSQLTKLRFPCIFTRIFTVADLKRNVRRDQNLSASRKAKFGARCSDRALIMLVFRPPGNKSPLHQSTSVYHSASHLLRRFIRRTPPHPGLAAMLPTNLIGGCVNHEGGKLRAHELQSRYMAALSKISGTPVSREAKRHTPIFQRAPAVAKKQAIRDAANALSALWNLREPVRR